MKLPRTIDTRRDALFWLVLIVVVSLLALSESAHVRMVAIGLFFLFLGGSSSTWRSERAMRKFWTCCNVQARFLTSSRRAAGA